MQATLIKRAIKNAGGLTAFSKNLGVRYQTVQKWIGKDHVPVKYLAQIEKVTGGSVCRHELAPELFKGYVPAHSKSSNSPDEESIADAKAN